MIMSWLSLICKGEKIANAGYLENVAYFCESYNLF